MQLQSICDQELIQLYLNGNERAFEELLHRHKSKIYTTIYMFVKDEHQAEDIFQEVFIKIIDTLRRGKYNHEGKFVQWAVRIAYNLCVDNFRRSKRRSIFNSTENFDIFDVLSVAEDSHEQAIIKSQSHERLRKLIDDLPPEQREVIILRHYADMSFKEISQVTRVSINTALGRMRYALINIRRNLTEKEALAI
ncbi:MAG TPA: sigma-70 family RNA polymerase sigma factor [Saprospiraceae bacterium]|jgi:RNA polymerase sigma-70 factor (ECF subfamily)|nr:MAG: ECF subfamily RNA polymerase sigma-24 subunit [Candidatus Parvibacillus calidus]MBX2935578.1 sigma-70 family RNA polymerase sigma factor [Saprospiraceae bacterium]MBK7740525.1 sigma-70 family RNA polymerase sigma factor [Candidatus Parvibacillus calidus]MBX7179344.1 sigma-70 family RNA polymerase sigma factor [Saprospiraceae bacterium]MCB0591859.1 sigma-70 family RNA polymerase sigma factor [Saprospiraceae bacterium]